MAKIILKKDGTLDYFKPLYDSTADINLVWGGRDYGKSDNVVRVLVHKCMTADYFKCIMLREYYDTIQESIYAEIKSFIDDNGLGSFFRCTIKPLKIEFIPNGNYFIGRGGDKPRLLKAIKNPTDLIADEADTIKEDTLDIGMGTLRGTGIKTQAWVLFNPEVQPDGTMMLMDKFFYPHNEDLEVFYDKHYTWKDEFEVLMGGKKVKETIEFLSVHGNCEVNPHVPAKKIAFYDSFKNRDLNKYLVWRLGRLGRRIIGNLFYQSFNEGKHVKPCEYDPNSAIYYAMDYNFNPYMPSSVWQVKRKDNLIYIRCLKEYALKSPLNSIKASCKAFIKDYKDHKGSIYLIDDATGQGKSPINADPEINSLRKRFKKEMLSITSAYKFRKSNPRLADRRDEMNNTFAELDKFRIEIDPSCSYTKKDFGLVKIDHDGKKLKEKYKAKDIAKGLKGEKYGHFSDIADYVVTVIIENETKLQVGSNWSVSTY